MTRLEKFHAHGNHPMQGPIYRRLSQRERGFAVALIEANEHLTDSQFVEMVNRLGVVTHPEFKNFKRSTDLWALLIQSIEPVLPKRRE